MGRGVGFAPALELKGRLNVLLDLEEMKDVGGDCFAIELLVEISTTLS
jgi:hypothetical protein